MELWNCGTIYSQTFRHFLISILFQNRGRGGKSKKFYFEIYCLYYLVHSARSGLDYGSTTPLVHIFGYFWRWGCGGGDEERSCVAIFWFLYSTIVECLITVPERNIAVTLYVPKLKQNYRPRRIGTHKQTLCILKTKKSMP